MTNSLPDLDAVTLDSQRAKQGIKWSRDPGAVAAWVADMDFPPAAEITAAMQRLLDDDDLGYLRRSSAGRSTPTTPSSWVTLCRGSMRRSSR